MTAAPQSSRVVRLHDSAPTLGSITVGGHTVDLSKSVLNVEDVAALLDVAVWTVYEHVRAGDLPSGLEPIKVGRCLRWPTRYVLDELGLGRPV